MQYPVEKHGIRFYHYYFLDVKKPISIEATNKHEARDCMRRIISSLDDKYRESKIVGESITIPLLGVSEKVVNGVKYIWVGTNKSRNGWLEEGAYKRALHISKMNNKPHEQQRKR